MPSSTQCGPITYSYGSGLGDNAVKSAVQDGDTRLFKNTIFARFNIIFHVTHAQRGILRVDFPCGI